MTRPLSVALVLAPLAALALVLAGGAAPPPVRADDAVDLGRIADLERLARRVEQDGFQRLLFEALTPELPDPKLTFAAAGNTVEKEKEFRRAWIAAYGAVAKDLDERGKAAMKDARRAREATRVYACARPRLDEIRALAAKPAEKETFAAREVAIRKFLKRYDFGPKIAKAEASGTAVVHVNLAPDTYELVRRTVHGWKLQPLKDGKGAEVKAGDKRVEFTDNLTQSELKDALRSLTNEYFVVRYAKLENEKEVDVIRVVGAKLLLGTYWFIEHEDRIIVARDPAK